MRIQGGKMPWPPTLPNMPKGGAIFQCITNLQVTKSVRYSKIGLLGGFTHKNTLAGLRLDPYPLRSLLRSSRHDVKINLFIRT